MESNLLIIARIVFAKIVHGMSRYCFNFGFQLLKIAIKIKLAENYNLPNYFATTIINASFIFWHFKTFFILEKNLQFYLNPNLNCSYEILFLKQFTLQNNLLEIKQNIFNCFKYVDFTNCNYYSNNTLLTRVKRVLFQLSVNFILKSTTTANG